MHLHKEENRSGWEKIAKWIQIVLFYLNKYFQWQICIKFNEMASLEYEKFSRSMLMILTSKNIVNFY